MFFHIFILQTIVIENMHPPLLSKNSQERSLGALNGPSNAVATRGADKLRNDYKSTNNNDLDCTICISIAQCCTSEATRHVKTLNLTHWGSRLFWPHGNAIKSTEYDTKKRIIKIRNAVTMRCIIHSVI